jgi:hypothetical protein
MTDDRLQQYQTRILKECSTGAAVTIVLREMLDEALAGDKGPIHDVDVAWINAEIERGHYSLLRARLAEFGKDSIIPTIIREELLQLCCAASRDRGRCIDYLIGTLSNNRTHLRQFVAELEIALDLETHAGTDPAAWIEGVITKLKGLL